MVRERGRVRVDDSAWKNLRGALDAERPDERARIEVLLKQEFDQAWNHYRQIETGRSQHLGFLFAALFALAPVLKAVLELRSLGDFRLLLAALVGASYLALALFVLQVVRRSNVLLAHYEHVLRQVRGLFYAEHYEDVASLVDVRRYGPIATQPFRISLAAERFALSVMATVSVAMLIGAAVAASEPRFSWVKYLAVSVSVVAVTLSAATLWRARPGSAGEAMPGDPSVGPNTPANASGRPGSAD